MITKLNAWRRALFSPRGRRYIYRVSNAGLGCAVAYGVLDGHREAAVLLVVNAVLGLADAHVDTSRS
jgi:hypothetical protein